MVFNNIYFNLVTTTDLSPGDFVMYDPTSPSSTTKIKKGAVNIVDFYIGYVTSSYLANTLATYYPLGGYNSYLSGLIPGTVYYADPSTPGGITSVVPTGTPIIQVIGKALSTTSLDTIENYVMPGSPSGSPIGPAGGDLTGTYPNPGVNWNNGLTTYDLQYYPLMLNPAGYLTSASLLSYLTIASAAATYYPLTNPAGYISGITSGDVTTALGYTPYDSANPAGYITSTALTGYLTSATAAATYYPLTNPAGYIDILALAPYLTTATAASTYVELAGDTMTGLLQFSGTTHAGIKLINLTTAQRNALTPSSGMLVLDTDIDEFCHYNGAGWEYDLNKSVASNVTTNVTGAANITGLSFSVEANSTFLVDCYYHVACSGVGGLKFTQTTPVGATMDITYDGIGNLVTTSVKVKSTASGTLTATVINSVASNSGVIVRGYVRTNANAGTLQMQFASNTNGQTSTIFANSWAKITRIA